jgi:hypothetical protein
LLTGINWKKTARTLAIYIAIGLFLSFLNPFNAARDAPFGVVLFYWVALMMWGGGAGEALDWALGKWGPPLPFWARVGLVAGALTLVILPALVLAEATLMGRAVPLSRWPQLAFFVLLISLAVTGLKMGFSQKQAAPAQPPAPTVAPASAFIDRLPIRLRTAIIYAVESEDHYLRVHTSSGQELILMRLADAVRELSGLDGLQTHRSWWVAKQGLADAARQNGKLVLKLKSGVDAPVSRTYAAAVREAGWV